MSTEYYKLGAKFCRHQYKNGGVCITVHESRLQYYSYSSHL